MKNWETEHYKIKFRATFRTKTRALSLDYNISIDSEDDEKSFQLDIVRCLSCKKKIMRLFD